MKIGWVSQAFISQRKIENLSSKAEIYDIVKRTALIVWYNGR